MVVSIQSAYLGDEKSRVNITDSLVKKLESTGEVVVDSSLLPILKVGGEVKLTDAELREAKEKAEKACGTASDNSCMEVKTQEFSRQRLAEKENEKTSSANVIKGRRMTVVMKNGDTIEIPEGQVYKTSEEKSVLSEFKVSGVLLELLKALGIIVGTGAYAFSILITYRSFIQSGYTWQAYLATGVSVFFPYSGFLIVFGWFGIRELVKNMLAKKQ